MKAPQQMHFPPPGRATRKLLGVVIALGRALAARRCAVAALLLTALFYMPSLRVEPGLLYTGDTLGYYLPALLKTHSLLSAHRLVAIDFSLFNGSSDFFLSPNFFALHPLVVAWSWLVPESLVTLQSAGYFLVLMLACHSFIACYFASKLCIRFLSMEFELALLVAAGFAFSGYMVNSMLQPPFLFCATIVPWATYNVLAFTELPEWRKLPLAAMPVVFGLLGGYLPLGVACLLLAAALTLAILWINRGTRSRDERIAPVLYVAVPYLVGLLVVSPYLFAVYRFHQQTNSVAFAGLFYSAHQLAEAPQSVLRVFAKFLGVPGPMYEFTLAWGVIAVTLAAIFFLSRKTTEFLSIEDWDLFKFAALVYFATALAIFGEYSVVSDLVYYLVPQVGKMHIYQRFLLPAHLLFMLLLATMLKAVVHARPAVATRLALLVLVAATCMAAAMVSSPLPNTDTAVLAYSLIINNQVVFELMLGLLFVACLFVPGRRFIYLSAVALMSLPSLNQMYDMSAGDLRLSKQIERQPSALSHKEKERLLAYLKRFEGKQVLKYVDLTPMWDERGVESFPKVYPYLLLPDNFPLTSYGGFTFYLSANADYMRRMPVGGNVTVQPDWDYVARTGADLVIAMPEQLKADFLSELRRKTADADIFRLPNGALLIPMRPIAGPAVAGLFDNGYFRVTRNDQSLAAARNLARGKPAHQSGASDEDARRAVDGNTDGRYEAGSVTHSGQDLNAWLDIDLGTAESVDAIRLWGRTDCCGYRLTDYWVFVSEQPFGPADTPHSLRQRSGVTAFSCVQPAPSCTIQTAGARGRYVRVQMSGTQPDRDGFLSLAEVEVLQFQTQPAASISVDDFYTDRAAYLRLAFTTGAPAQVQYLLWNNPRLRYFLNGSSVTPKDQEGVQMIEVPAGHNTIEIKYRHMPLMGFWVFYALFTLSVFWALLPPSAYWKRRFR